MVRSGLRPPGQRHPMLGTLGRPTERFVSISSVATCQTHQYQASLPRAVVLPTEIVQTLPTNGNAEASPHMSDLPVDSISAGYRIERVLGAGGMGTVYLARNPDLPRSEAIKILSVELSRDPAFRTRFI